MENNRNYHNNSVTTNREGTNPGTYRHSAHTTRKMTIGEIRDKIAIFMVFTMSAISMSSIFGVILVAIARANPGMKIEHFVAICMVVGFVIFAIFGYCTEYIECRIKKNQKSTTNNNSND